jgi:Phytanoyl-CoA dioxygenase (PhyH)
VGLTAKQIEQFVDEGFVKLDRAFPEDVGEQCLRELWAATGCDPSDRSTWTQPFIRLDSFGTPAFRAAANTPVLLEAFDQLVGAGRWTALTGLGTFPLRFPSTDAPAEAGWHVEAGFAGTHGEMRVNVRSRGRALLMLFLFSEVGHDDAPTQVRVGSHLDVPQFLEATGDDGAAWMPLCEQVVPASAHRRVERATGSVGDVYLCHPFLVHTGTAHRGTTPRFMAQPPLRSIDPLDLDSQNPTPVARAVIKGLYGAP